MGRIRCLRCLVTFLRAEDYLAHRQSTCRPASRAALAVLTAVGGCVSAYVFGRLVAAANAEPGGVADWARTGVAVVLAAIGGVVAVAEMRRQP